MAPTSSHLLQVYLAHRSSLVDSAAPIVGDRHRAEDVVQDAYFRLADGGAGQEVQQPLSYIFRLVRNLAIDRKRRLMLEARHGAREEVPETAAAAEPSPEQTMLARESVRVLERALAELPERTRMVFEMHRIGGRDVAHIAAALDISQRLVYLLLRDAMDHCRKRLFGPSAPRP